MFRRLAVVSFLLASTAATTAAAQQLSKPDPLPFETTVPEARDVAYPGTVDIHIDATDTRTGVFHVTQTIPVADSGPMTLLYPLWIPGHHSPTGPVEKIAGLHFTANGKELAWKRDTVHVSAYHIDVPDGADAVKVRFDFVSPTASNQGRIMMTPEMLSLEFEKMTLYPAGYYVRDIPVDTTVEYPKGWTAVSGLPANNSGSTYRYQQTNYQVLVDSPVIAGKYYKQWELTPQVDLNAIADTPDELEASDEQIDKHRNLVKQAVKLFGAQHYDQYEFLLTISDHLGGIGLEHHRSSEDGTDLGYFTDWENNIYARNLLPHEFTHSWNGKFRRPADLWTPDYQMPMRDSGLWVYEGQTQFWGYVLQARSGLVSKQHTLDGYARILASYDNKPELKWRSVIDSTNDPIINQRSPRGWYSYQGSEDYYNAGLTIWMAVDSLLREKSNGAKSLDDFAKAFFGIRDGDWGEVPYRFDDVVATLNGIMPYDWASFLKKKLDEPNLNALEGFERNGYTLVYTDTPSDFQDKLTASRKYTDATYSIGLNADSDGEVSSVRWNSPAFEAGLDKGSHIVAVNGAEYSGDRLTNAIRAATDDKAPIKLLVEDAEHYREVAIDYHDGLRYPHLEKTGTGTTGLDRLLQAK